MATSDIEFYRVLVPAVASFMGALLAGVIAIVTSILSSRLAFRNSAKMLRQNSFSDTITKSYQKIVDIVTSAVGERRILTEKERGQIAGLLLWVDDEILGEVKDVIGEKDLTHFMNRTNRLIDKIRKVFGVGK